MADFSSKEIDQMNYRIGIIGAGFMGKKRAEALQKFHDCRLVAVADTNPRAAEELVREFGGRAETDWKALVEDAGIDALIVSTFNKFLASISMAAVRNRKHVLCEKPLAKTVIECRKLAKKARENRVILKTGFNLRHHPAICRAKQLFDNGSIGKLFFIRCRYGHGGRVGYEKEWRGNKDLAGGGELLDQGIHVADLFRWFAGDFRSVFGTISSYYWNMDTEDNASGIFRKKNGIIAILHVSCTQWKNLFSFEIFGSEGYLIVEGLGGHYGKELLIFGKRKAGSEVPEEKIFEFPGQDISWENEWWEFLSAIESGREPSGSGRDGFQANRMIHAVYDSARKGRSVRI
jgi:predicted dehydrogenase